MKLLVFGATGRVGQAVVEQALEGGHSVTAVVRDPGKVRRKDTGLNIVVADLANPSTLANVPAGGYEGLVNVIGVDPLKPSTVVTQAAKTLVDFATRQGIPRYVAITGTAQMPKTFFGWFTIGILNLTPVGNASRDHQGAYQLVKTSSLLWSLVGCPYIADGPRKGRFRSSRVFPGGFKTIHPGDVAQAIVEELEAPGHTREIRGIWY